MRSSSVIVVVLRAWGMLGNGSRESMIGGGGLGVRKRVSYFVEKYSAVDYEQVVGRRHIS